MAGQPSKEPSSNKPTTITRDEAISRLLATTDKYQHSVFGQIVPACLLDSKALTKEEQESVLYSCFFIIKAAEEAQKAISHMSCATNYGLVAARLISSKRLHKVQLLDLSEKMSHLIIAASELINDIDVAIYMDALDLPATINLSDVMQSPSCPNNTPISTPSPRTTTTPITDSNPFKVPATPSSLKRPFQ